MFSPCNGQKRRNAERPDENEPFPKRFVQSVQVKVVANTSVPSVIQ